VVSQTEIEFVYKNSIVHFCTPDDALVARNILSFYIRILFQFVKPPSDNYNRLPVQNILSFIIQCSVL
jgi:hypothetical protein